MLIIDSSAVMARALASSLAPDLKELLSLRRDQLLTDLGSDYELGELAKWIIVDPDDALTAIEAQTGISLTTDPPWEWVLHHAGIFEAPIILSDDGFGIVLIVPDNDAIDATLLAALRSQAICAPEGQRTSS